MNNPELYQRCNNQPKRDVRQCLEEYSNIIKWKSSGGTVIDIGCGDGSITSIMKTFIPDNYKALVGCDINEKMIQFANAHHATDSISFTVIDIESDLPDQFREKFDHAFSSYALQWIKHQEKAFSNIYDLLVKGGDCLLIIMGQLPMYDIYRELARIPRWSHLLKDFNRYVSPYHDCQDPEKVKRMMTTIGFTNIEVKCVEKEFVYPDLQCFKNTAKAINPFRIPLEMEHDYWEEYMKVFRNLQLIHHANHLDDDALNIKITYSLIIIYATKQTK